MIDLGVLAWQDRAACKGQPADLFFPPVGRSVSSARSLCGRCPVQAECLDWAIANYELHGIWGGMTERQRRAERRRRKRATT